MLRNKVFESEFGEHTNNYVINGLVYGQNTNNYVINTHNVAVAVEDTNNSVVNKQAEPERIEPNNNESDKQELLDYLEPIVCTTCGLSKLQIIGKLFDGLICVCSECGSLQGFKFKLDVPNQSKREYIG